MGDRNYIREYSYLIYWYHLTPSKACCPHMKWHSVNTEPRVEYNKQDDVISPIHCPFTTPFSPKHVYFLYTAQLKCHTRVQAGRRSEFDRIVIETTGLANPAPIIQTFFMEPDIAELVVLDGVVTLVDAKHVGQHLDEEV